MSHQVIRCFVGIWKIAKWCAGIHPTMQYPSCNGRSVVITAVNTTWPLWITEANQSGTVVKYRPAGFVEWCRSR